jgi:hypothetical protein
VKVLFIMGMTRSGSTLLDNILGEFDGFVSCGELRLLWKRGLIENRQCGCGRPVRQCERWTSILHKAFGDEWETVNYEKIQSNQRRSARIHHTWSLLRKQPGHLTGPPMLTDYVRILPRLYRSIAEVSCASVIVDSSKRPSDVALLRLVPELDIYVVHLVRDPRAVAYSWSRLKRQPERNGPDNMAINGPVHTTLRWLYRNLAAGAVARKTQPGQFMRVRYEDFVCNPRRVVRDIVSMVTRETPDGAAVHEMGSILQELRAVALRTNHTVSGNPSRFRTGVVPISEDREWLFGQSLTASILSTLFAMPLLRAYGYPLSPKRAIVRSGCYLPLYQNCFLD